MKFTKPPSLRGTFQSSWRAITSVRAATPLIATATSQADLPYPTTSTFLPRASSASLNSVPAHTRPPAAVNSSTPGYAGTDGSQNTPFATTSRSKPSLDSAPPASRVSSVQRPSPVGRAAVTSVLSRSEGLRPNSAAYPAK